jgi:ferredoxin
MKATVDNDTCIGCGICMKICPHVFGLGEGNKATVIVREVPPLSEACARDAQHDCPVSAITIEFFGPCYAPGLNKNI